MHPGRIQRTLARALHYAATDEARYIRLMDVAARTLDDDEWAALSTMVRIHLGFTARERYEDDTTSRRTGVDAAV